MNTFGVFLEVAVVWFIAYCAFKRELIGNHLFRDYGGLAFLLLLVAAILQVVDTAPEPDTRCEDATVVVCDESLIKGKASLFQRQDVNRPFWLGGGKSGERLILSGDALHETLQRLNAAVDAMTTPSSLDDVE